MKKQLKAVVAIALLCFACAAAETVTDNDLLIKEKNDFSAKERLSKEDTLKDISILKYALQNGYAGSQFEKKFLLKKTLRALDSLADKGGANYSSQKLCDEISKILYDFPDNHLSVYHIMVKCGTPVIRRAGEIPGVGDNFAKKKEFPWELNEIEAGNDKVLVISLFDFYNPADPSWEELLAKIAGLRDTAPAMIFDLRGNGGGNNAIPAKIAKLLYGQKFPSAELSVVTLQTPAAFALAANDFMWQTAERKLQGLPAAEYMTKGYEENISSFTLAKKGGIPALNTVKYHNKSGELDAAKLYKGPVYFLTDRRCVSSCESMLEMFEAYPGAVTVGDNTGGALHFCPLDRYLILPNSRIHVSMSSRYNKYKDGRFVEKTGYAPKLRVPAGEDALKAVVEKLKKELAAKK